VGAASTLSVVTRQMRAVTAAGARASVTMVGLLVVRSTPVG
jgi:hypothetical protein